MALSTDDLTLARTHFEAERRIGETLAAADPRNVTFLRILTYSLGRLGDIAEKQGDIATAIGWYEKRRPIDRQLVTSAPDHPLFRKDLTITERRLADLRTKEK